MSTARNPPAPSRITLRGSLITLGVLLVVINIGSAAWDLYSDRRQTVSRAQLEFSNLSGLLAEHTATLLEAVDLVLRDVVREPGAAKNPALASLLSEQTSHIPQVAAFLVIDAGGRVIARTNEAPTIDTDITERPYFTAHRDGRVTGLFFSAPYQSMREGKWRFAVSRRLEATGGRFDGVVVAVMEIESFDNLYRAIDPGGGRFITLRSQDGTIITRVPDPMASRGRQFDNPDINPGIRREGRFTGWTTSPILNESVFLAASAVRGFPLQVLSGSTEHSVFAPWRREASRIATRTLLTSGATLALIALAAWGLTRRERALQRSERRFRAMIERSSDVELLLDPIASRIIYASPSVERVLGYTPEEALRLPMYGMHPEDFSRGRALLAELALEPCKTMTLEHRVTHRDGTLRWAESTLTNMLSEPDVRAVVMNLRDITERRLAQAEQGRLEQRLRQGEKMEAGGRLAGGIAHDFNNILGGILGYAELLTEQAPEGSPLRRYARNVLTAANRARGLVDQILAYSRSQRVQRAPIDLGRIVAETLELVRGSLPAGMQLQVQGPSTPLFVMGDATQLHQVLMNLCTNALQAMSGGGTLRVSLESADARVERVLSHGNLQPGSYVQLTREDRGPGMDEATIARIFEPFFTTKEIGKGTGLGLSLVYGIVTDSGGGIDVASTPGRGSTFAIYLPRVDAATDAAEEQHAPVPRGKGERVLVVDDE